MDAALAGTDPGNPAPVWGFLSGAHPESFFVVVCPVLENLHVHGGADIGGGMAGAGMGVDQVSSVQALVSDNEFVLAALVAGGVSAILLDGTTLDDGLSLRDHAVAAIPKCSFCSCFFSSVTVGVCRMGHRGGFVRGGDSGPQPEVSVFCLLHCFGAPASVPGHGVRHWVFGGGLFRLGVFGVVVALCVPKTVAGATTGDAAPGLDVLLRCPGPRNGQEPTKPVESVARLCGHHPLSVVVFSHCLFAVSISREFVVTAAKVTKDTL